MTNNYYITRESYIELSGELADNLMRGILKNSYDNYIITDKKGNESYTVEGQEIFEEQLNEIEDILEMNGIHDEEDINSISFESDINNKPEGKVIPFKGKIDSISGDEE